MSHFAYLAYLVIEIAIADDRYDRGIVVGDR